MHAVFIPYGKKEWVDLFVREMQAQKHQLRIHKKGKKDKIEWINSQVRILPFGFMEYVFPKEDRDVVLTTLNFGNKSHYLSRARAAFIRKLLKLKKIPKYKSDINFLWIRDHVSIIPIGIKEDSDIVEPQGEYKGWEHEGI